MPVDLTPLSAPVTKLIEVVAKGIGTVYEPIRIVREAKAHARAELILAATDDEIELRKRAAARVVHMEIARQENIERVVEYAGQALPDTVSQAPVEQGWINHFFASVQDVSSADLQSLWGRILAGEVTSPGRYSRRLIEFLKTVDKSEADMLTALLSVTFTSTTGWHFYFSQSHAIREILRAKLGNVGWQTHLTDIGIISSQESTIAVSKVNEMGEICLAGALYALEGPPPPLPPGPGQLSLIEMWISVRNFTSIGQQIASVAQPVIADQSLVAKLNEELAELKVAIRPMVRG